MFHTNLLDKTWYGNGAPDGVADNPVRNGGLYINMDNGHVYANTGTVESPDYVAVGGGGGGGGLTLLGPYTFDYTDLAPGDAVLVPTIAAGTIILEARVFIDTVWNTNTGVQVLVADAMDNHDAIIFPGRQRLQMPNASPDFHSSGALDAVTWEVGGDNSNLPWVKVISGDCQIRIEGSDEYATASAGAASVYLLVMEP